MKAFASWSGGKDCMLALQRYLGNPENSVECLVNMCNSDNEHSRSHGIHKSWIQKQAALLDIPLVQPTSGFKEYEDILKKQIEILKKNGVEAGVFGDIYLEEHRTWINRVCMEMEIKPVFPLWGEDTGALLKEFIGKGFKTIVVAINEDKLNESWLGRIINDAFYMDIIQQNGIDPCAENGEYHSFVFDGPLFKKPVEFAEGEKYRNGNHKFLELISND